MNNEIKNEKVQVPNGIKMNDKDYLNSLLSRLKDMTKGFNIAMTEASNDYLYDKYLDMFNDLSEMQREVFEVMFQKGWYILEKVDSNKIGKKYNLLNQDFINLTEDE